MNAGRLTLYVILVCANVAPAFADSLAWLYGRVLDPSGAAIPDAAITVVDQESGFRRTAQSQLDGELPSVPYARAFTPSLRARKALPSCGAST